MSSSSRDKRLEVDELLIHFKKISSISHKYAINKPTSSYSPQQTKALETILTVNETSERQRRSTIDSWTAAAMNQASMGELMPTKKSDDDDVEMQQRSNDPMPTEEDNNTQQNSGVNDIETSDTKVSCEDCCKKIEVSTSVQLTTTKKRRNNDAQQCSTPIDDWVDSVMREVAHMMPKEVITTETSRPTLDDSTKSQDTIYKSCESSIISALTASITSSSSSSSRSSTTEVIPSLSNIQRRHKALKDKMDKIKSNRQDSSRRHFNHSSRVPGQAPSIQSTLEKLGQRKQAASGIRTSFTSTSTSATEGSTVCSSSCFVDDEINESTVNNLLWS